MSLHLTEMLHDLFGKEEVEYKCGAELDDGEGKQCSFDGMKPYRLILHTLQTYSVFRFSVVWIWAVWEYLKEKESL